MGIEKKKELPVIPFGSQAEWREWLELNHSVSDGIWLQFYKKGSGVSSVKYAEALDEALCYGWIDAQLKAGDENFYLQRFTPRRRGSTWSRRNVGIFERLEKEGKVKPPGRKAVEVAMQDGRWENAYDSQSDMKVPDYLHDELLNDPESLKFFESLDKINTYAIVWRLQSAKNPETRAKRLKAILEMLEKREKIH